VHRNRVEIEYFIALLSMSPPLPQLAAVKPEPVRPLAACLPPSCPCLHASRGPFGVHAALRQAARGLVAAGPDVWLLDASHEMR
jgi:hypothetical protein